jgi:hypothetical protein
MALESSDRSRKNTHLVTENTLDHIRKILTLKIDDLSELSHLVEDESLEITAFEAGNARTPLHT